MRWKLFASTGPIHNVAEASISRQHAYRCDSIGRQAVNVRVRFEKYAGMFRCKWHWLVEGGMPGRIGLLSCDSEIPNRSGPAATRRGRFIVDR